MSATATRYEHIVLDREGVPLVAGTTMKVVELVTEKLAHGSSPEELQYQHPYLTLGQIYSALAYYWDHRTELDADIERRLKTVDDARTQLMPSPVQARLRRQGRR